ncbi:MAG: hypothetical protein V4675_24505 [Verrucomicrobiota bacterium]
MKATLPLVIWIILTASLVAEEGKADVPDLKQYEAELAANPDNQLALYNAGLAAQLQGDAPRAMSYWTQLCHLNPTEWKTQAKLIQALSATGKTKERDDRIAALKSSWKSGNHPELSEKKFFIRDQFSINDWQVFAFDYYQLQGERPLVWKFLSSKDGKDGDLVVSLGSYKTLTNAARANGEIGPDQRIYHLDGYTADGGHQTFGIYLKCPTYDEARDLATKALQGKLKPMSSYQPGTPEGKPDAGPQEKQSGK